MNIKYVLIKGNIFNIFFTFETEFKGVFLSGKRFNLIPFDNNFFERIF
jgi:hypothetical protein